VDRSRAREDLFRGCVFFLWSIRERGATSGDLARLDYAHNLYFWATIGSRNIGTIVILLICEFSKIFNQPDGFSFMKKFLLSISSVISNIGCIDITL